MQHSLKRPETLDLVTLDATGNECALIISTVDDWDDSEEEQALLLQKINNYVNFLIDGGLERHYPQTIGKSVRIQIDSVSALPISANQIVTQAQALLLSYGVRICVNRVS